MGFGKQLELLLQELAISVADLSRITGIPASTLHSIIARDSNHVGIGTVSKIELGLGIVPGSALYNLLHGRGEEKTDTSDSEKTELQKVVAQYYQALQDYKHPPEGSEDIGEELYRQIWELTSQLNEIANELAKDDSLALSEQEAWGLWLRKNGITFVSTRADLPAYKDLEKSEETIAFKVDKNYYFITEREVEMVKEVSVENIKALIAAFDNLWREREKPPF